MTGLQLDANLGGLPPQALLDAVAGLDPEMLRRYPDTEPLERVLAARFGVGAERVLVTAGADDAIDRICRARLRPGRSMVLPVPSFEMMEHFARLAGGAVVPIPWTRDPFPLDAIRRAVGTDTGVVVVVSPNNPTGAVAAAADLEGVAEAAGPAAVLLDHAYVEYAAGDLTARALALPNVIVVRTLSKAWGLAGCRVGYALGSPKAIDALRRAGAPYPVAAPSVALGLARLAAGERDMRDHVTRVRAERAALCQRLTALGLEPWPSEANFVLVECGRRLRLLMTGLADRGVRVRAFPGRAGLETALRISLPGAPAAFAHLLAALDASLAAVAAS
jgi:histidinol-phosphate aminotransferase